MIGLAVVVFVAIVAGAYLHELVHLGVAKLFGARVALDPVGLEVMYEFEGVQPRWVLWSINLAPQACGVLGFGAWYALDLGGSTLGVACILVSVMLLAGGRDDYRLDEVDAWAPARR